MHVQTQQPRHIGLIIALVVMTLFGSLPGLSGIQVIDRDEARYAQASQHMFESEDYVNIRFHDRERHKKPVGIYWAQTLMLKVFGTPSERKIWVHRLPSVIGGLMAVLGLYWAGIALYDRRTAFVAALLLSSSLLFIFESHIAKTDAAICASAVWVMGAVMRLRMEKYKPRQGPYAVILWAALGAAVIIKGPIIPAIFIVSILSAALWDLRMGESIKWLSRCISPLGLCLFGVIVLPWFIMIGKETGGAFYGAAIGGDLAPKLTGGQENHAGYPGYYTLTIFAALWPAALFLLAALSYGLRAARGRLSGAITAQNARWLLCWIIPFWIILELIPTKLPHYPLPLYPAIALLMAGAISSINQYDFFKKTRIIGAVIFFMITISLIFIVAGADTFYGADSPWVFGLGIIIALTALITTFFAVSGHMKHTLIGIFITGLGLSLPTYGLIMPNLNEFRLAPRIMEQMKAENIPLPREGGPLVRSPHFTEPSLVYYLGTNILLGEKADDISEYPHIAGQIWLIDMTRDDANTRVNALKNIADYNHLCLQELTRVNGSNYSKGDDVDLTAFSLTGCTLGSNGPK